MINIIFDLNMGGKLDLHIKYKSKASLTESGLINEYLNDKINDLVSKNLTKLNSTPIFLDCIEDIELNIKDIGKKDKVDYLTYYQTKAYKDFPLSTNFGHCRNIFDTYWIIYHDTLTINYTSLELAEELDNKFINKFLTRFIMDNNKSSIDNLDLYTINLGNGVHVIVELLDNNGRYSVKKVLDIYKEKEFLIQLIDYKEFDEFIGYIHVDNWSFNNQHSKIIFNKLLKNRNKIN